MSAKKPDLTSAYALTSAADAKRLYGDWAENYDQGFAETQKYTLPIQTARAFVAAGGRGPVLDAGAGTGLCGQALYDLGVSPLEATDISPEMLAEALRKDIYRDVIEADLLEGIPVPRGSYRGVVSSGTFTHGHIGPEALPALLRVAAHGAQFALSINAKFYHRVDFDSAFARLRKGGWISDFALPEVAIYDHGADPAHGQDTAYIALFKRG